MKKISLILFILISIEIFYMSSIHGGGSSPKSFPLIPIIYHATVFFLFAFFTLILTNKISLTIIISILYATLDEIHQIFVPGRGPSTGDVLIDSLGIFAAVVIYILAFRRISAPDSASLESSAKNN